MTEIITIPTPAYVIVILAFAVLLLVTLVYFLWMDLRDTRKRMDHVITIAYNMINKYYDLKDEKNSKQDQELPPQE